MTDKPKTKRPHLGKGLEALLGPITQNKATPPDSPDFPPDKHLQNALRHIPIADINPNPYQPRTTWDQRELGDLADSIRTNGVIQPVLVRAAGSAYEVIAGERRLRAAQQAGLDTIPALLRKATDDEMLELALVENVHRTDLNPIERALAYRNFITTFSLTQAQAAQRLGEDRSVIANYIRLLDLPSEIKQMLIDRKLTMGHARAMLALPTDDLRKKLANKTLAGRLSVRQVERLVQKTLTAAAPTTSQIPEKPPHIADLEQKMREYLGTKVNINTTRKGTRGKIIIEYYSLDDFDRLAEKMGLTMSDNV